MPIQHFQKLKSLSRQDFLAFLRFMVGRFKHARLQQVAGNLTFTTLLALVPLLTIALALFTMFPAFGTLKASLEAYFAQVMMPKPIANTILRYLTVFTNKAGHLSIIGAVGVLFASMALMGMIERAFNQIWRVRKRRSLLKRMALYLTLGVLGPFLFVASLTVTSNVYFAAGGTFRHPTLLQSLIYAFFSIVWMTLSFTVLYVVMPNRTIHWREAVCGGIFAAITFEIVKRVFAIFILDFTTYRKIYGAVAAIPVFLLWIYLSWLITLSGAAFVAGIHYLWHGRWRQIISSTKGSAFVDAMTILGILHEAKESGVDEAQIREMTGLGLDEVENLLECMESVGWVAHFRSDPMVRLRERKIRADTTVYWKLTADPLELTLAQVFRLFVFGVSEDSDLARKVDGAIAAGLNESLSAYFLRQSSDAPSSKS
ncbi:MAG: YihY family inner membrane protein [Oxalobacter sp.]|nr:MAG: YihY family inner membrane protein [Oxalobacter sp.]